jgi:hypothetical protein
MSASSSPVPRDSASRGSISRGAAIGAIWLIGVGTVLLVQQLTGWPWIEAWPLFIILVGVASLASVLIGWRARGRWPFELGGPLLLTAVGVVLLLSTIGALGEDTGELIAQWWPVVLIAMGLWFLLFAAWPGARPSSEGNHLSIPLPGTAEASIRVRFGGGELTAGPAPRGVLLDGSFEAAPARAWESAPGRWELESESPMTWAWWDRAPRWHVGLTTEVPLELRLEVGAAKTRLDLAETLLRRLRINTGASDTVVRLPRAAGETFVRAEGGAASLTLEVPTGVAARIRSRMALGGTDVDARFPRTADGWESPDWNGAANRVEIEIQGGLGSARVVAV